MSNRHPSLEFIPKTDGFRLNLVSGTNFTVIRCTYFFWYKAQNGALYNKMVTGDKTQVLLNSTT
jgi:hypothetical protein